MTTDLTKQYQAALAAEADAQKIMGQIKTLLDAGTHQSRQAALRMRPAMDRALTIAAARMDAYKAARDKDFSDSVSKPRGGGVPGVSRNF